MQKSIYMKLSKWHFFSPNDIFLHSALKEKSWSFFWFSIIQFSLHLSLGNTSREFNCQSECQRVLWSWAFQDIFIHDVSSVCICYTHILKLPWNSYNSSIQNTHEQNYMDSAMISYSCPFEDQCFPFSSLT